MIEKNSTGILALLNEECKMPKGNDESFLRKLVTTHGRNKFLGKYTKSSFFLRGLFPRTHALCFPLFWTAPNLFLETNPRDHDKFSIVHYAETVPYTVTEFISKNRNTLNADVTRTMILSEISWIREIFAETGMSLISSKKISPVSFVRSFFFS